MSMILFDPGVLDGFANARHREGCPLRPSASHGEWADDGNTMQTRRELLRTWLESVLGTEHFHLALQIFVEGMTCEDFGGTLARDRSTGCRQKQRLCSRLRAVLLAAVSQLLQETGPDWEWVQDRVIGVAAAALAEETLLALASGNGSCTISPRTARPVVGVDRWAVSLSAYEERHEALTLRVIRAYVLRYQAVLFESEDLYLCVQFDMRARRYRLDVTKLFPSGPPTQALAFTEENKQQAVINLRTLQAVRADDERRRRTA